MSDTYNNKIKKNNKINRNKYIKINTNFYEEVILCKAK